MPAMVVDLNADVRWRGELLEWGHGDEWVVAGGHDQGRHLDLRDDRQRRRAAVVVQRVREAAARGCEEIVESADGQPTREFRQRWLGIMLLPDAREPHQLVGKEAVVEAVARLLNQFRAADNVDRR